MSTVISTVLIASPPAFLVGWILSKALLRQGILRSPSANPEVTANPTATSAIRATAGPIDQPTIKKIVIERQQAQQLVGQLREQLVTAQQRLQPLQTEVQLLKEAVAEREHQVLDLRRKLQLQSTPPEVDVRASMNSDVEKDRQALKALRDRLTAQEQQVNSKDAQLTVIQSRLQAAMRRARKWRLKLKPLLRQYRQQRTMIGQLRDELRQRELEQQNAQAALVSQSVLPPSRQPAARESAAAHVGGSRGDYTSINQENLQVLRGLGPALQKKLNERGIYRLGQLAELSPEESERLCRSLGIGQKTAARNDWSARARELLGMTASHPHSLPAGPSSIQDVR